jgi:cytochrome c553
MRAFTDFAGLIALVYASIVAAAAPASPQADVERGKQIATTVCAACHGPEGTSTAPANPNLAAQHAEYMAAQLAAFKSGARPSPIMAGMAAGLSPEDMASLGAWYQSQKPATSVARDKALALRGQQIWPRRRQVDRSAGLAPVATARPATACLRNSRVLRAARRSHVWVAACVRNRHALPPGHERSRSEALGRRHEGGGRIRGRLALAKRERLARGGERPRQSASVVGAGDNPAS